jgi:hypothetical protein
MSKTLGFGLKHTYRKKLDLKYGGSLCAPLLPLRALPGAQQGEAHLPVAVQVRVEAHRPVARRPKGHLRRGREWKSSEITAMDMKPIAQCLGAGAESRN